MLSKKAILIAIFVFLSGCANVNDSLTPSLTQKKDSFDGSLTIYQAPVSAASKMSEAWHTLGFEWNQKFPNVVFLEVGTNGVTNIMGAAFNVDGKIIENIKEASRLTEYGSWSTRRLVIPISDFVTISEGKDVKMKLIEINTYSVSSFGKNNPSAIVNKKFPPFIQKLKENKAIQ